MRATLLGLAVVGLVSAGFGCAMLGFGGGGGGGGGSFVQPAISPYANATDLSDYKEGRWVTYRTEAPGTSTESTIKVVGSEGDNLWIEVAMIGSGMENTHLLLVQPDRKVVKAYFAGKDDEEWKRADINEYETAAGGGGAGDVEMEESDESKTVPAGDFACHRIDATVQGNASTTWYCKEVFQLQGGGNDHGGMVAQEASGMTMVLAGMGVDAKPKMEIPTEEKTE